MICSKLVANALGLSKQDNTNGTCAAVPTRIVLLNRIVHLNTVNRIVRN